MHLIIASSAPQATGYEVILSMFSQAFLRDKPEFLNAALGEAPAESSNSSKAAALPTNSQSAILPEPPSLFTNSLGMRFRALDGNPVAISIWETRVRDYAAYARTTAGVNGDWSNATFEGAPVADSLDAPVVNVSWEDALAFCDWLTQHERQHRALSGNMEYRLPTDAEWSAAVGIPTEPGVTAQDKDGQTLGQYPWGSQWPPPTKAGNYADSAILGKFPDLPESGVIKNYADEFSGLAPVGSFPSNRYGIYDLGGNAWEWCQDYYDGKSGRRVARGAGWLSSSADELLSSCRMSPSQNRRFVFIGFRVVLAATAAQGPR